MNMMRLAVLSYALFGQLVAINMPIAEEEWRSVDLKNNSGCTMYFFLNADGSRKLHYGEISPGEWVAHNELTPNGGQISFGWEENHYAMFPNAAIEVKYDGTMLSCEKLRSEFVNGHTYAFHFSLNDMTLHIHNQTAGGTWILNLVELDGFDGELSDDE
ncbi:hypothetical protein K2W90_01490 [Candidatus Babeliales bacterium]|nr:hypothetical protein [Candidatus Babeliales bacterium]